MLNFPAKSMRHFFTWAFTVLWLLTAHAQSGTVTGQVFCSDTQKPARFAHVRITDAYVLSKTSNPDGSLLQKRRNGDYSEANTTADGTFVIKDVPAGVYDLEITYPGYIQPRFWLNSRDIDATTLRSRLDMFTQVTVPAGRSVNAIATVYRGGELGGTVTYDDGSPAVSFVVSVLMAAQAASTSAMVHSAANLTSLPLALEASTDNHGRFLISGLVDGTYSLAAHPREGHNLFPLYLGNTVDQASATLVAIRGGEERDDLKLEIDLNSYHQVRGMVTKADHQPLPSTGVSLDFVSRSASGLRPYTTTSSDGSFVFSYVPDGNFELSSGGGLSKLPVTVSGTDINDVVLITKP